MFLPCGRLVFFFLRELIFFKVGSFGFLFFAFVCDGFFVVVLLSLRWHLRLRPRGAGVAPVRGGTHFLCRRKESKGRSEQPVFLSHFCRAPETG
ncbi:hypothetical protein AB4Y32_38145, partial [Paraburkholderia phymatum]